MEFGSPPAPQSGTVLKYRNFAKSQILRFGGTGKDAAEPAASMGNRANPVTRSLSVGGLGPALFGTLDLHQEVAEGRVKFEAGNLDLETALAWLAPFEHCDFTQLAAW